MYQTEQKVKNEEVKYKNHASALKQKINKDRGSPSNLLKEKFLAWEILWGLLNSQPNPKANLAQVSGEFHIFLTLMQVIKPLHRRPYTYVAHHQVKLCLCEQHTDSLNCN